MPMRKWMIGLSLLLSISILPAYSATAIKAGSVCSKQGITKVYKGKTFKCIKSKNKLVWSKGKLVKQAAPLPTPTPVATLIPSPTPTPEIQLPIEYSRCSVLGAKVANSTGAMRCSWMGHANTTAESNQRFVWLKHVEFKVSTSQSNN